MLFKVSGVVGLLCMFYGTMLYLFVDYGFKPLMVIGALLSLVYVVWLEKKNM